MNDYITPKLQTAFDKCGFKFMQQVTVNGIPGFVQGIFKDDYNKLWVMVSHKNKDLPEPKSTGVFSVIEYDPKDVKPI